MNENRTETILLVEDEDQLREMLATYLHHQGYRVLRAEHGEAGLALFKEHRPDITISDLKMPVMDGMTFLQEALKVDASATILMLTAFATMDSAVAAMKAGAYDYLTKPIEDLQHDFLNRIEMAIQHHHLTQENEKLNRRLREVSASLAKKQKAMDAELAMAAVVQQSLLPSSDEKYVGLEYGFRRLVAEHVSGDFYDIYPMEAGRYGVWIGQVFGRDMPSALLMSTVTAIIRNLQQQHKDPLIILNKANNKIKSTLEKGFQNFVTAFYGVVDLNTYKFRFACASHPAPLLVHYRPENTRTQSLIGRGNYLGKYMDPELTLEEVDIRRGDLLFLYTESLLNVQNAAGETYGIRRLQSQLERHPECKMDMILEQTITALKRFDQKGLQGSDMAMMAIRLKGMPQIELKLDAKNRPNA